MEGEHGRAVGAGDYPGHPAVLVQVHLVKERATLGLVGIAQGASAGLQPFLGERLSSCVVSASAKKASGSAAILRRSFILKSPMSCSLLVGSVSNTPCGKPTEAEAVVAGAAAAAVDASCRSRAAG